MDGAAHALDEPLAPVASRPELTRSYLIERCRELTPQPKEFTAKEEVKAGLVRKVGLRTTLLCRVDSRSRVEAEKGPS